MNNPQLLVQCGEMSLETEPIKDYKTNPNFTESVLFHTLVRNPWAKAGDTLFFREASLWCLIGIAVHTSGGDLHVASHAEGGGH